ncbi:MAG: phosphate ABC transporter permease subunit PstC [Bacteroidetes bacterium]|nr:phosphate ABC transporter permease subunit PstC [Bacteroidota bacterium]
MQEARKIKEKIIEGALLGCASLSILTTVGIIIVLVVQLFSFFQVVSVWDFLTDTQWTPLFDDKHFGIIALLSGTFLTTVIAIAIALPFGLIIAIYLSEYAKKRTRQILKPMLEVLATVPTVVYGFFALTVVTPFLQKLIPGLAGFNALSPGIVMGIMIIPLITSMSEDAMYAVPRALREGAYALGSSTFQTAWKVVVPSASSGIIVSVILATSRAIGETMIVAIAAGQQPRLTLNPLVPIETVTTYIVQVSMGDVPHGSIEYQTIFAAGFSLFVFTFALNNLSFFIKKKYAQVYE